MRLRDVLIIAVIALCLIVGGLWYAVTHGFFMQGDP